MRIDINFSNRSSFNFQGDRSFNRPPTDTGIPSEDKFDLIDMPTFNSQMNPSSTSERRSNPDLETARNFVSMMGNACTWLGKFMKNPFGNSNHSRTQDSRTHDSRTHDSRTHDSRTQDSRTQDSRTQDSRTQDSRTQDSRTQNPRTQNPRTQNIPTTSPSSSPSANRGLLNAVNKARREHGLNELTESRALSQASKKNDDVNNATGQLGHHIGLINGADGEITAMASGGITAEQAVEMWLNSPGHRAILLDPNQTEVGVDIQGDYATVDFH